jgi:hypothetical protein
MSERIGRTDVETVTPPEVEDCILKTTDEPEPSVEVEPGSRTGVTDDGSPTVGPEMAMEECPPIIKEEERPQMILRAKEVEIGRISRSNREKLKTWMEMNGKGPTLEAAEAQSDD